MGSPSSLRSALTRMLLSFTSSPHRNAQQFVGYNMSYNGIVDWMEKQKVVGAKA